MLIRCYILRSTETTQKRMTRHVIKPDPYEDTTGFPRTGPLMTLFLITTCYTFKYYYVVHPHTQYRDTMLPTMVLMLRSPHQNSVAPIVYRIT